MTTTGQFPPIAWLSAGWPVEVQPGSLSDRQGRLSETTVAAVVDAGFAGHFVPRRWGGRSGRFSALVDSVATVAEDCASAAWCAGLWAWHARFAARLPLAGQAELWADTAEVLISAGLVPPVGTADPVPGGYRLHGRWDNVSGAEHATWLLLAAPRPAGPPLVLAVARKDCVIERTWASAGLHASGTDTVVVSGVTVPEHRTIDVTSMLSGDATAAERCHAAPAHLAGGLILAAVGVGAGRAGMAAWRSDAPQDAGSATALARSAAELNAAELVLADAARRADEEPITAALVARNRRDAAFAADLAVTATERLFRAGGAAARDTGSTVNRAWRDVHTVAAHGALRFDAAAQAYVAAAGEGNNG